MTKFRTEPPHERKKSKGDENRPKHSPLEKKAYILMLFRNREGKSKHKVCLIMRRGTTNE